MSGQDAIAYIRQLATDENVSWFTELINIAIQHRLDEIPEDRLEVLWQHFDNGAPNDPQAADESPANVVSAQASTAPPAGQPVHVASLSNFAGFRKLDGTLTAQFVPGVTVVFGTNRSGKSSICLALRCLARTDEPRCELLNVFDCPPEAMFEFALSDGSTDVWSSSTSEYGAHSHTIAYFDGETALQRITSPIDPATVVQLAPFSLDVFEVAGEIVGWLEERLATELSSARTDLLSAEAAVTVICTDIVRLSGQEDEEQQRKWIDRLSEQTATWDDEQDGKALDSVRQELQQLQRMTSPEAMEILKRRSRAVVRVRDSLEAISDALDRFAEAVPAQWVKETAVQEESRKGILAATIPTEVGQETFLGFLERANAVETFDEESSTCPLCRQPLDADAQSLFAKYQEILGSAVAAEISALNTKLADAAQDAEVVKATLASLSLDEISEVVDEAVINAAHSAAEVLSRHADEEPAQRTGGAVETEAVRHLSTLRLTLNQACAGFDKEKQHLDEIGDDIATTMEPVRRKALLLEVQKLVATNTAEFAAFATAAARVLHLKSRETTASFPNKKRKLTMRLGEAHGALAQADFEDRLDAEYRSLAGGLGLSNFGITLQRQSVVQGVHFMPGIGKRKASINRVLSEGEQRLHALALFFAEAETRNPNVLVFDDPSLSFDFNYTDDYVERIRQYAQDHPGAQMILFTHNWEFYSKLAEALRKYQLLVVAGGGAFEYKLCQIENCANMRSGDHERVRTVRQDTLALINGVSAPTTAADVRAIDVQMRHLIECTINAYVFRHLRHRYNTRHTSLFAFDELMQVRPLTQAQAQVYQTAVAKLSDWVHDSENQPNKQPPTKENILQLFTKITDVVDQLSA